MRKNRGLSRQNDEILSTVMVTVTQKGFPGAKEQFIKDGKALNEPVRE